MTVIVQLSDLGIHYLANGKLIRYLLYTLTGNLRCESGHRYRG